MYSDNQPPYDESHVANPDSPYGISKRTIESLLLFYQNHHQIQSTVLRYANVYGPRQNAFGEAGVICIFQDKIKNNISPTIIGDGSQTRDFIHVSDVVSANIHTLENNLV
jgi:UDP-glucose 4-epimerase